MRRINYHEACALWMWFFSVLYYKNSTVGEAPAAFQLRREGTVWPRPRKPPEPWPMPIGPNRTWAGRIRNPGRRMHRSLGRRHTQPQASEHSEGFFFGCNTRVWTLFCGHDHNLPHHWAISQFALYCIFVLSLQGSPLPLEVIKLSELILCVSLNCSAVFYRKL